MTNRSGIMRFRQLVLGTFLVSTLAGCGTGGWFGDDEPPPLPGERISVLQMDRRIEPDPVISSVPVSLPPAAANEGWPQAGGHPGHAMGHPALAAAPREAWRRSVGAGSSSTRRLTAPPVVSQGRVYAMDADHEVAAFDEASGRELWRIDLRPETESGDALGGGLGFGEGSLFATTGFGEVVALDPASGTVRWRARAGVPLRAAPTVANGRVYVVSVDNQAFAFDLSGNRLWSHTGILETAGLLGAAAPAADGSVVVVPYSSGELFALRAENGIVAWSDSLAAIRRVGALSGLADIRGMPVIDRGLVVAVSHSGRMAAIDQRSGIRVWEREIGGTNMPWVAGDYVFVLSNEGEVVAMTRDEGRIRWVASLPRWEDPEDREELILWSGPILAGNRLWLVNNRRELVALSPRDGSVVSTQPLPSGALMAPIVANGTLYVLGDNGTLTAFR